MAAVGRWVVNAPKNPSPGDYWLTPEGLARRASLVEGEPVATLQFTVDQLKGMGHVGLYEPGVETSGPPAWALALPAPDGSRLWWTGGLRDTPGGGRTLATSPLPGDAMAFPTAEEAREIRETWLAAFPWLADKPVAGGGSGKKVTTVKTNMGLVFQLTTTGP